MWVLQPVSQHPLRRVGFTLVELMISVAIALVLILGVSQVFKISAATVGAGQVLSDTSRASRTAHSILWPDVHNIVTSGQPGLILASKRVFAYRNAAEKAADTDNNSSTMLVNGATINIAPTATDDYSHRIDVMSFFAAGDSYARQTGSDTDAAGNASLQYAAAVGSSEAWIWYGHAAVPNNAFVSNPQSPAAAIFGPADPDGTSPTTINDNNAIASEWILGRFAMLLVPTPTNPGFANIYITGNSSGGSNNPLGYDAISSDKNWHIFQSRYDIAATSVTTFGNTFNTPLLREPLIHQVPLPTNGDPPVIWRYQANPFPKKPLTPGGPVNSSGNGLGAGGMAGIAPIFIRGCSQFMVEYAGDYVKQSPTPDNTFGTVTEAVSDNEIDYIVDKSADSSGTNPALWVKKIRWYGFPRDLNGDGHITVTDDVVPLRDVRATATTPPTQPTTFERFYTPTAAGGWPGTPVADYAANALYDKMRDGSYVCSWGTDTTEPLPRLLRITIAVDDPNGRLAEPQVFEYVIDVQ